MCIPIVTRRSFHSLQLWSQNSMPFVNYLSQTLDKTSMQRKESNKGVPISTAWRGLSLRMEEWHPVQRVAANVLNKQSRTADKEWSSSWGIAQGPNTS